MSSSKWVLALGGGVTLLGSIVLFGWMIHQPRFIQWLPGLDGMPYSTALGFILVGVSLMLAEAQIRAQTGTPGLSSNYGTLMRTIVRIPPYLSVLLGSVALVSWVTHRSLGLAPDAEVVRQWFPDSNPYLGKMRPLAAMAFVAAGLAIIRMTRSSASRDSVLTHGLSLFIMFIGLLGIVGEIIGAGPVFSWFIGPVFLAGVCFVLVSLGLLALNKDSLVQRPADQGMGDANRISLIAGAVALATGSIGLIAGFATLYPQSIHQLENGLALSLVNRTTLLNDAILNAANDSSEYARLSFSTHPLQSRRADTSAADPGTLFRNVTANHLSTHFSGILLRSASGTELAKSGSFALRPELSVKLGLPGDVRLLWEGGFVVHSRIELHDQGVLLAVLETERRLNIHPPLNDTGSFGDSLDFPVCARATPDSVDCFPFRSSGGKVLHHLPHQLNGKPIPVTYALAGGTGIVHTKDYRGIDVIAAYRPIGSLGLGADLKIDTSQLYGPIAIRLHPLLYFLPLLGLFGALLLRLQMVPLLRRLSESEFRFRQTLEHAPIGMILGTTDGRLLEANTAACQMLGYSLAELKSLSYTAISHPDDLSHSTDAMHQVLDGKSNFYRLEKRYLKKDGQPLWAQVTASLVPGSRDDTHRFVFQIEDIGGRKHLMDALRHSEERFRTLAQSSYDWEYWRSANRDALLYISPSCEQITGYLPDEFIADPDLIERIVHPEDQLLMKTHIKDYQDNHEHTIDFRIIRKNGATRWLAHGCRPIYGENGEFRGRRVSNRDISERKQMEAELTSAKERLAIALDASSLSIWDFDIRDDILFLDERWAGIMGNPPGSTFTTAEELMPRVHPEDQPRVMQSLIGVLKGSLPFFQEEFRVKTARGEWKWILCSGKVNERDSDGRAIRAIGTNRDISEHKAEEEQVHHWAYFDRLTNLPNRRLLEDRMQQLIAQSKRTQQRFSLLFVDLDKFKPINDEFGHEAGDWLLQSVAKRMQNCLRDSDTVARIGGDEFVILLPNIKESTDALEIAEKIRRALEKPFITDKEQTFSISSSIGIALFPDHASDLDALLKVGDEAMYAAKKAGRNAIEIYAPAPSSAPASPDEEQSRLVGLRLHWNASYACGEAAIDQEHQQLFHLANALLELALIKETPSASFTAAFDALLSHVVQHFSHEEAILLAHGYEHLERHIKEHRDMVEHALRLRRQVDTSNLALGELVEFLITHVVTTHILQSDKDYFGVFQASHQSEGANKEVQAPLSVM